MPTNDLPAAAAEMLDLFQDALSTHVYSMDDGETPPVDCPMVASIQRVRNALELPPMLTPWVGAQPAAAPALPSTGLGGGGPMGSVWGTAKPSVHWLNRDQAAAIERDWMLCLNDAGQIVLRGGPDVRIYKGLDRHDRAANHVYAIAETPLPPYPATDKRVVYRDLCQRAVAIVEATAAGWKG